MKAMILAAGRGERMRPLTDHTPKPLLQAGGKPLIVWHIERLVQAGIVELVINHAHLGTQIEQVLGDGGNLGARIIYSDEGTALETAGGIAFALAHLGEQPFAVINGDIYCEYDFARLPDLAEQMSRRADHAHLVMIDNPTHHPNGDFCLNLDRVIAAASCPDPHRQLLTFSGIGLYQPSIFSTIQRGSREPLAPLLRDQIALDKVSGEHYRGLWVDVGTPQRLTDLDSLLRSKHNAI
ncbi:MAG: nucleotidyltransferase family protein [Gallionella sp.]